MTELSFSPRTAARDRTIPRPFGGSERSGSGEAFSLDPDQAGRADRSGSRDEAIWRARFIRAAIPCYLIAIGGIPTALVVGLVKATGGALSEALVVIAAPALWVLVYVAVAGCLSRLTRRSIVPGRFPRRLGHSMYGPRRLYALCWTAIYYCPPVYHAVLAVPLLKKFVFRLFGYRGSLDVVLYPDTWIRDLPLLELGPSAYLSNRCTVGTNMCLINGDVLVAPVKIGAGAMVGHLTMLAPGVTLSDRVEIGVGAGIGLNVTIGSKSSVGPCTVIHHGVQIGDRCVIGSASYIGTKSVVGNGVTIPPGTVVPARSKLLTNDDVLRLIERRQ